MNVKVEVNAKSTSTIFWLAALYHVSYYDTTKAGATTEKKKT